MTREESRDRLKHLLDNIPKEPPTECDNVEEWLYENEEIRKAIETAIKALSTEPCEDAISRQAVLDLVVANHTELNGLNVVMYSPLYKDIKQLPPVNPTSNVSIQITEREKYGRFN